MLVAIGKATKEARPRGGQLPMSEVIIPDHFQRYEYLNETGSSGK
jgi:hypothetical protein